MKNIKHRFILLALISTFITGHVFAQQKELDTLVKKIDQHRENALQEKIYAHVDRNFYLTGETLWFKIYCVDGTFNKPLDLSKVAYLEILDRNNISSLNAKISLENGFGSGSIFIPASISSGNYTIRAYTQWMKNYSPEFFFHKTISIVNPFIKPDREKEIAKNSQNNVNFFPEGGNLVANIKSKVGFKIADNAGKGVDCRGAIINEQNDTIVSFKTLRAGIGHFFYTPVSGAVDKVVIIDNNKKISTHKLPVVNEHGYVMTVTDSMGHVRIHVKNHLKEGAPSYIYLFVHARQQIVQAEVQLAYSKSLVFTIDQNKIKDGISHITLFDSQMNPLCERLFFKYPSKKLSIKIEPDQQQYGVRRKVKINIATSDKGKDVPANLSVSIFKLDSLSTSQPDNIFNFLWFTSDLVGTIESPEFYLSEVAEAKEAMDNLMLTHGWRRFSWDNILNKKHILQYVPEYRTHIIRGNVTNLEGKPEQGTLVYLSSPGKVIRLYPSQSNINGEVKFEVLDFWGTRQIIAQTDSTHKVTIENPFSVNFTSKVIPPLILSSSIENSLIKRSIGMQVQDVYYENNREQYIDPGIDSLAFYGKADETYLLDDFTRFPVMEEVMREYVSGVLVRKRRDGFHFIVLDNVNKTAMRDKPLILLDGVPLFDADKIMSFDPRKIKKLEVLTRPYYLGSTLSQGIVSYTTYGGDLSGFQLDPQTTVLDYEGLQLQREFYKPQYENQQQRIDRTPDQRSLLYWNPIINTNDSGKNGLEFFTSDLEGTFMVEVEGITKQGVAGSAQHIITVKRFDN